MAREISVSFALGAKLDGSYGSAFKSATGQVRGITQAIRDMEKSPVGRLGASLVSQQKALRGTRAELDRTRGVLETLRARSDAAGGASGRLATQISQAEREVAQLTTRLGRQNEALEQTRARAATAGGSVQGLIGQYRQLRTEIDAQRKAKAKSEGSLEVARAEDSQRASLRGTIAAMPVDQRRTGLATMVGEQRAALKGMGNQLREAQQQLANLRARATETGGASGLLARQIRQAEETVAVLNSQVRMSSAAFRETVAAATSSGASIRSLSREYRTLSESAARAQRMQQAVQANDLQRDALRQQRGDLNGRLMGTMAQVATVALPVKLGIDWESSMADVKKVTDFDDASFKVFSKDLLDMSTRLPITAKGLAEIAAAAGAAGIAESDLKVFAEDAAKMGVAFDISAKEAGEAMTGLRNNFKLSQDGVRLLGDSMNALSNSMDAKAAHLVDFANRAGGTATIYKFTGQEVSALGAAFLDAKVGVEQASTATNAMLVRLGTADTLSDDAQEAFKSLGLSGEGMAKAFREDAQGSLLKFLQTVGKSEDPMRALNAIFGAEHAPKIAKLVNNLGRYGMALDKVSDAKNYQGSLEKEYSDRAATTANSLQLLQNSTSRLGTIIGSTLLPVVGAIAKGLTGFITGIGDLSERFPLLTTVVMVGAAAIAGLAVGSLFLGLAYNGVRTSILGLRRAKLKLIGTQRLGAATTWGMTAATSAWNVAARIAAAGSRLFAGGLRSILVATGVGAVLVALGLAVNYVIDNWETIGPAIKATWDSVVQTVSGAIGGIVNFFVTGWAAIKNTWERLGVFFTVLGGNLGKVFAPVVQGISGLFRWAYEGITGLWANVTEFFSNIWAGMADSAASAWSGITGFVGWAYEGVTGLWADVTEFFSGLWSGIAAGSSLVWGEITGVAQWAYEGVTGIWSGVIGFFGSISDGIAGVFSGLFSWLRENFDWVFNAINGVAAFAGKISGAVSSAWDAAFGNDAKSSEAKVTPVASGAPAPPKTAAPVAEKAQEQQEKSKYQARADAMSELLSTPASGKGKKGKKGGGSGSGRKGTGPVTIVSLAGDNSAAQTVFIPASSKGSAGSIGSPSPMATSGTTPIQNGIPPMPTSMRQPMLPQSPAVMSRGRSTGQQSSSVIKIDLKQTFDLITTDSVAVKKVLASIKPDMEALVRRALETLELDRRRTQYAQ